LPAPSSQIRLFLIYLGFFSLFFPTNTRILLKSGTKSLNSNFSGTTGSHRNIRCDPVIPPRYPASISLEERVPPRPQCCTPEHQPGGTGMSAVASAKADSTPSAALQAPSKGRVPPRPEQACIVREGSQPDSATAASGFRHRPRRPRMNID